MKTLFILIAISTMGYSQHVIFTLDDDSNRVMIEAGGNTALIDPANYDLAAYGEASISIANIHIYNRILDNEYPQGMQFDFRDVDWRSSTPVLRKPKTRDKAMKLIADTWFKVSGGTADISHLTGTLWQSAYPTTDPRILQMGTTFEWADHPDLHKLELQNPSGFIIDNGTTGTVVQHNDFIRAGMTGTGVHVAHQTAMPNNPYTGTTDEDTHSHTVLSVGADGVNTRVGGSSLRVRSKETRTTSSHTHDHVVTIDSGGDPETAPDHRVAYFGIYGDQQ